MASYPNWVTPYDYNETTYESDNPGCVDEDPRSPNGTGPNVGEIFAMDAPGLCVGTTNDYYIGAPQYLGEYEFDMEYRAWVQYGGIRISNYYDWYVHFDILESNGKWSVNK